MSLLYLLMLAVLQGVTEFLPVSSSGHLELLHIYVGTDEGDLALDIAVHLGTLCAVILYFRHDVGQAIQGLVRLVRGDLTTYETHLALCLIVATIPVVICGLVMKLTGLDETLRTLAVIGWAMILFGLLLYWYDRVSPTEKAMRAWTLRDAVILGLWQAVALIPGTSRSGITITGARALGYAREDAARMSMLMSIPTIAATGAVLVGDVVGQANWELARDAGIAAVMAFLAALAALALMMRLLRSVSFTPYVVYRLILGSAILWVAYGGAMPSG